MNDATDDIINILQETTQLQVKAMHNGDSGWQSISTPKFIQRGMKDYKRILYLPFEPNDHYIKSLYEAAPQHNDRSMFIIADREHGLWVLTLSCTLDSSD